MALDAPAPVLALSDIIHTMSPSPAPQLPDDLLDAAARPQSHSPEPLDSVQVEAMRKRAVELSLQSKISLSPKEKELVIMILRLTSSSIPDTAQIVAQAETIADLTQQRDFLFREIQEERARWEAEKQGFDRMAEALIGKRSRGGDATYREEELERQIALLDSDNRALRAKIADYHIRVQSIEAELAHLRPVLLMQPFALTHSFQHSHAHHSTTHASRTESHARPSKRRKHAQPVAGRDPEASEEEANEAGPSSAATPKHKPRGEYYRRRDSDVLAEGTRHRRLRSQRKGGALLSDARAEHLLLAARKLGRERATVLAGMASAPERDRKKEEETVTATPKTPKRTPAGPVTGSTMGIMQLDSPAPPFGTPAVASTSQQTPTPQAIPKSVAIMKGQTQDRSAANHQRTPLDSLLTAARSISMIEDEGEEEADQDEYDEPVAGPSRSKPLTRGRAAGLQGSPLPLKRRRIAGPLANFSASRNAPTRKQNEVTPAPSQDAVKRTRSGLDVLADQAAAAFSSEKAKGPATRGKGKGKAKAKEGGTLSEASRASTARGRSASGSGMVTRARGDREAPVELLNREQSPPRAPPSIRKARGQPGSVAEPLEPPRPTTPPPALPSPPIPDEPQRSQASDSTPHSVEPGGTLQLTPPHSVPKSPKPGSPMAIDHTKSPEATSVIAPESTATSTVEPDPVTVIEESASEVISTPVAAVAAEPSPVVVADPSPTETAEPPPPVAVEPTLDSVNHAPALDSTEDMDALGSPDSLAEDQDAEGEPDPQSLEADGMDAMNLR